MRFRAIDRGCSSSPTPSASGAPTRAAITGCSTAPAASCGSWAADAAPASLMHAKFAPSGSQVAYVRENNIYVEDLVDGRITKLTNSSSPDEINGTFDWVYEEEFSLRDGFRWSPDGKWIAYWQLDTRGVPEFPLVNNTDSLYPRITNVKYPKVGEKNAACRVGVVSAAGGETRWLDVPGDPRDNYIAYLEWAGTSSQIVLQQFNRHQNTVRVMLANVSQRTLHPYHRRHGSIDRDQYNPRGSRRRLDRSPRRTPLGSRRPRVPLAQRARRLAASLPRGPGRRRQKPQTCDHRRLRRDPTARRRLRIRLGLLHGLTQEPHATVSLPGQARRDGPRAQSRPPISRERMTTSFRRTRSGRSTAIPHSTRSRPRLWSDCPSTNAFECSRRTRPFAPSSRGSRRSGRSSSASISATACRSTRWCMLAAGIRSECEVPVARARLWRAGGPDRARPLGRLQPSLAPDARSERLRRDELRQSRNAVAPRAGLAKGGLPPGRHPGARRTRRPR